MLSLDITPTCTAVIEAGKLKRNTRNAALRDDLPALTLFLNQRNSGLSTAAAVSDSMPVTDGFKRIKDCHLALESMDRQGWDRSYFQRKFHDSFMQATARAFWKNEGNGQFARDHQKILETFQWDNLAQEILISTPRRFGKTISVSMFAAAMMVSCASVEISIYSTCKRISQKLLRNVRKFIDLVFLDNRSKPYRVIRENAEEIFLQGPEGPHDIRVVNSYPSRVPPPTLGFRSLHRFDLPLFRRYRHFAIHIIYIKKQGLPLTV
jgi:hypothetical protein